MSPLTLVLLGLVFLCGGAIGALITFLSMKIKHRQTHYLYYEGTRQNA